MLGTYSGATSGQSFSFFISLTLVVVLVVAGRSEVRAPLIGAAALHVLPAYWQSQDLVELMPAFFGITAVASAVLSTGGAGLTRLRRGAAPASVPR